MWRRVIFLLNNLPYELDTDSEDDSTIDRSVRAYHVKNLAGTYRLPLERILSSGLNEAGYVRSICVNFGPKGYYELNPDSKPVTQPQAALQEQLNALFQAGIVSNPANNQVVWSKITDLSTLMSNLPPNSRKIGCVVHGYGPQAESKGLTDLRDYIRDASNELILVFVVGQINTQEIQPYIDDFVKVSDYDVIAYYCLDSIIYEVEKKWGI